MGKLRRPHRHCLPDRVAGLDRRSLRHRFHRWDINLTNPGLSVQRADHHTMTKHPYRVESSFFFKCHCNKFMNMIFSFTRGTFKTERIVIIWKRRCFLHSLPKHGALSRQSGSLRSVCMSYTNTQTTPRFHATH